jgi:hypothetical protein
MKTLKTHKMILLAASTLMMVFAAGCGKDSKGRSSYNNNGYYGNGYGNGGPAGATGAVGTDSYGRFALGIRLGAGGTLRIMQPLGCFA